MAKTGAKHLTLSDKNNMKLVFNVVGGKVQITNDWDQLLQPSDLQLRKLREWLAFYLDAK